MHAKLRYHYMLVTDTNTVSMIAITTNVCTYIRGILFLAISKCKCLEMPTNYSVFTPGYP